MALTYSPTALQSLGKRHFGTAAFDLEEMPGGASLRRFFRLKGDGARSAVGMFFPDATKSEEASAGTSSARRWPFLEVRDLLEERGVDVPLLLAEDCTNGLVLVEDLGEQTLADALLAAPERKTELYRRVVRDLAYAHVALDSMPEDSIVRQRSFELDLLSWELDHFREWGLLARGIELSAEQHARFSDVTRRFAEKVRALPYAFSHRDFQSRNLMLVRAPSGAERVVWIDFQDALLGPRVYDLVALLNDSYQTFTHDFVTARLGEYCEARGDASLLPRLLHEFDVVTVQRKLKDAGRFVFIKHKKGDASYLPFVEPTIRLVRQALSRLSEGDDDARTLAALLAELLD